MRKKEFLFPQLCTFFCRLHPGCLIWSVRDSSIEIWRPETFSSVKTSWPRLRISAWPEWSWTTSTAPTKEPGSPSSGLVQKPSSSGSSPSSQTSGASESCSWSSSPTAKCHIQVGKKHFTQVLYLGSYYHEPLYIGFRLFLVHRFQEDLGASSNFRDSKPLASTRLILDMQWRI